MANTPVASNNKSVTYGLKTEREMSDWQNRGITESSGSGKNPAGLTNTAPMKKIRSKTARKSAKRAIKRGMISEKAAKKHLGGA